MTPLCELARAMRTDKGGQHSGSMSGRSHAYTPHYYEMWKDRRLESLNILEIGVEHGRSMTMWRSFFPNSIINGWDIDISRYAGPHDDPNIRIMEVAVGKYQDWNVYPEDVVPILEALRLMGDPVFDFIIDDGDHCDAHQALAVKMLLPHLHPRGIFCVEDHDTLQPPDVYVPVPEGYTREILCNADPWHDSLLQVIRHVQ
jgi:hypothetical protein